MQELLLVEDEQGRAGIANSGAVSVVQQLPPHVVVIDGPSDAIDQAARVPGVSRLADADSRLLERLSFGERVFVDAWRKRNPAREHEHEGLNWGTFGPGP